MGKVSYDAQIRWSFHILDGTVKYYRDAVKYIVEVVLKHYDELASIKDKNVSKVRQQTIEHLIHTTENNQAVYREFDKRFYKFPSYLRRDAITKAYGIVDSWKKQVAEWKKNGCKGKRPRLNRSQECMPCFYKGNTFIQHPDDYLFYEKDEDTFMLKVWHQHDWVWIPIVLRECDLRYIKDHCLSLKEHAPVLVKKHRKYYLNFCYDTAKSAKTFLKDHEVKKSVGVDLGVNTDAVCSAVSSDGTVTGRKFINHPAEKDRQNKILNFIKSAQRDKNFKNHRLWRFVNYYSEFIATDTARQITMFAREQDADIIVFEHLSITGRIRGSKAQKIALWRKRGIQKRTEAMAARYGIRVTYVCASGTSKYAFDGSGEVTGDEKN